MPVFSHLIWTFTLALAPALALADAVSQSTLRAHCSDQHFSQTQVTACLEKAAAHSAQALSHTELSMKQTLQQWDEDERYIQQAQQQLARSQKAFAAYREQQCQLLGHISGGAAGNAQHMRYLACTAELNQRRATQLLETMREIPQK